MTKQVKQVIFWVGALVIGAVLGSLHIAAILTALFTKSSAATLPVTMDCVENRV